MKPLLALGIGGLLVVSVGAAEPRPLVHVLGDQIRQKEREMRAEDLRVRKTDQQVKDAETLMVEMENDIRAQEKEFKELQQVIKQWLDRVPEYAEALAERERLRKELRRVEEESAARRAAMLKGKPFFPPAGDGSEGWNLRLSLRRLDAEIRETESAAGEVYGTIGSLQERRAALEKTLAEQRAELAALKKEIGVMVTSGELYQRLAAEREALVREMRLEQQREREARRAGQPR